MRSLHERNRTILDGSGCTFNQVGERSLHLLDRDLIKDVIVGSRVHIEVLQYAKTWIANWQPFNRRGTVYASGFASETTDPLLTAAAF